MKTHKIVRVDWIDPANYGGWKHRSQTREFEPSECISIGILTKVKRGNIGLMQSIDDTEKCAETMVIPRKAIKRIEVLSTFKR
jgi:hypothetical protein